MKYSESIAPASTRAFRTKNEQFTSRAHFPNFVLCKLTNDQTSQHQNMAHIYRYGQTNAICYKQLIGIIPHCLASERRELSKPQPL